MSKHVVGISIPSFVAVGPQEELVVVPLVVVEVLVVPETEVLYEDVVPVGTEWLVVVPSDPSWWLVVVLSDPS